MTQQPEPQDQHRPDDAASPVPNRRERRGGKRSSSAQQAGKSAVGRKPAPTVPPRQYSTRRRSG
ncbi:MAG TPA: hypothetical protein VGO16_00610 [Pseudonocardiaceae bacterium]|jgi:hypothetical protein|nr:hypothetical protein [Pseudonocardiaceae bacterium]